MADDAQVLDFLRESFARVYAQQDRILEDLGNLKSRVTSLEVGVAQLHGDFAGQSVRIDRIEQRLERIEGRLDLVSAS